MRITTIILLGLMHISANTYSQNEKLNLKLKSATVEQVIEKIKEQSDLKFLYRSGLFDDIPAIDVEFKKSTIKTILDNLLVSRGFAYEIKDKVVVIRSIKTSFQNPLKTIQSELKGRVTDAADNSPMVGVTVYFKGSTKGTMTDDKGEYTIKVPGDSEIIVFSYIGYETIEIKYDGGAILNIAMNVVQENLEQVVVTGYRVLKKDKVAGAAVTVDFKKVDIAGATSIANVLQGEVAGLFVRNNSGRPGDESTIIIRGLNTLNGSTQPLWIVDGLPMRGALPDMSNFNDVITNGLGNIPPEDIESITILKDAAAASIYGTRAANGVVVVVTKMGRSGKIYFNYNGSIGLNVAPTNKLGFMNTQEKIAFERVLWDDFHKEEGAGRVVKLLAMIDQGLITNAEGEARINELSQTNTDWFKELYRDGIKQSHSFSMEGGTENTTYYLSANFLDEEGTLKYSDYNRYGLNTTLTHKVSDNFKFRINLGYSGRKNKDGVSSLDSFNYATFANPYEKPYNEDGSYAYDDSFFYGGNNPNAWNTFNILYELENNTRTSTYGLTKGSLYLEYNFWNDFKFISRAGMSSTNRNVTETIAPHTYTSLKKNWMTSQSPIEDIESQGLNNGQYSENNQRLSDFTVHNTIEYSKIFNDVHFVNIFLGNEFGGLESTRIRSMIPGYEPALNTVTYPDIDDTDPGKLSLAQLSSRTYLKSRYASFFGRLTYSYDDRYVFNLNGRFDGVNIIGTDNQFTPLMSAGLLWNAHNESFIEKIDFINLLRLNVNFGYSGSIDRNSAYPFATYNASTGYYNGILRMKSYTPGNPSIKWEEKEDLDMGLEVSLFDTRLNVGARYYKNTTRDIFGTATIAYSTGRDKVFENFASVSNKGFEFDLRTVIIDNKDWRFETNFNLTKNDNKIIKAYRKNLEDLNILEDNGNFVEGYPIRSWFGYESAGIDPATGHMNIWQETKVLDVDGNETGEIVKEKLDIEAMGTPLEKLTPVYLGSKEPKIFGGFGTSLRFKNLELRTGFTYVAGNKIVSFQTRKNSYGVRSGGYIGDEQIARTNIQRTEAYRWRMVGDITDIPKYESAGVPKAYNRRGTFPFSSDLEDGSYLKCNNISLSYNLPKEVVESIGVSSLRITGTVLNPFILTNYSGINPEVRSAFTYPVTKSYLLNINLRF